MAATLLKAVTAIGLKTTAFLQSLFLFPFNTVLQAVHLLPSFRQTKQQPILPCSTTSAAAASSSSATETRNNNTDDNNTDDNNTDDNNNEAGDGARHSDTEMTTAPSSSSAASAPVPKIVPALPRAPLASRENRSPTKASPTKTDAQLSDKLSRLDLDETEPAAEQAPSASLQDVVNGTGSRLSENGTGKQGAQTAAQQSGPGSSIGDYGSAAAGEVTRALPVPLTHTVSQTSRPKETAATTTMQLDGVTVQIRAGPETPEQAAERAMHSRFMREALDMARLALKTNETPVGCVLVYKDRVIARGMNATNVTRNGTRHAELMAISALLSYSPSSDLEPAATASPEKGAAARMPLGDKTNQAAAQATEETSTWGDVDPQDGHLYPYGQKLHPSPRVDPSVITECTLYVTVEPCVMCASLLRQFGVKKVYFGAVNDKFGGTGGVFRIHKNSPCSMASAPPSPAPQNGKGIARPLLERRPASAADVVVSPVVAAEEQQQQQNPMMDEQPAGNANGDGLVAVSPIEISALPGDGGNIERGYEAEGGWGRDEAVTLLRQFYVQENNRAPVPRKKEGRAARLAAMMERDGHVAGPVGAVPKSQGGSGADTPAVQEEGVEAIAEAVAA